MHISFVGSGVPDDDEDRFDAVLKRLDTEIWHGGEGGISIQVRRRLAGLGGSAVLEVQVHCGSRHFARVVKIGPAAEMRTEYEAYEKVIRPTGTELCPPIETCTPGARDGATRPAADGLEAIVYNHVGQYVGEPEAPLTTLEDVFTAASLGDRHAALRSADAVASLFFRAGESLYNGPRPIAPNTSLQPMLAILGPDIVIDVHHLTADDRTSHGDGETPKRLYDRTIWRTGITHQGKGRITSGELVTIDGLTLRRRGDDLIGRLEHARVAFENMPPRAFESADDGTTTFRVTGRVVSTRPDIVRRRMLSAVEGLAEDGSVITAPDVRAAHPYASLREALTEVELCAVHTRVHGDLNSRNVLLVDSAGGLTPSSRPYLIDYACSQLDRQFLADFAWLEINLMRAIGGAPCLADLVLLQRVITVAAALLPSPERGFDLGLFDRLAEPLQDAGHLALIWPVLLRLRWEAYLRYPKLQRQDWFADYGRHLALAAHRTFKWDDELQSPTRWAASVATAAVAGEWTRRETAFRHWDEKDLAAVAGAVTASARPEAVRGAQLLAALTQEIDSRRGKEPCQHGHGAEAGLTEAANSIATTLFSPPAEAERRPYIDLSVVAESPAAPPTKPTSAVEALTGAGHACLVGGAGSGKTTVVRETARRMGAVAGNSDAVSGAERHRLPVVVPARDLLDDSTPIKQIILRHAPLKEATADIVEYLLQAGCLHVFVDGVSDPPPVLLARIAEIRRRHPRTPVLLCSHALPAPDPAVRAYRLLLPGAIRAVTFLAESAVRRGIPMSTIRSLLRGRGNPRVDELFRTPMGLGLLAEHLQPHGQLPSLADLLDLAFPGLIGQDHARGIAGRLAAEQVDHDETVTPETKAVARMTEADRRSWPSARRLLIEQGVLQPAVDELAFSRLLYRDHFAALHAVEDTDALPDRALRLAWQEPLRLAVSRRSIPAAVSAEVLRAVRHTDPEFAGPLLAMAVRPGDEALREFAAEQDAVLRDPSSCRVARDAAARALRSLGEYGVHVLCAVAGDGRMSPAARLIALRVLEEEPAQADAGPVALAARLLDDPSQPAALRTAAVKIAVRYRAVHLAVLIAEQCDADAPWAYVSTACSALVALGAPIPRRVRDVRLKVAARRLDRLVRVLPRLTTKNSADAAQRERAEILQRCFSADPDLLLDHRFAFEIGEIAADLMTQPPDAAPPERWPGLFVSGDEHAAALAAHRLLLDAPDRAGELIAEVRPGDPSVRLLAAAAAASAAGPACLPRLEELVLWLLDQRQRDAHQNEALAALLTGVRALDQLRGGHLAARAHALLAASGTADRLRWPLRIALARCAPRPDTWETLLAASASADRELAADALASVGFHLEGAPNPAPPLSEQGRHALLGMRPESVSWEAVNFIRAAATARLTECLTFVDGLLAEPALGTMTRTLAHAQQGVLTLTGRSEVLSAAGYLARHALLTGDPDARRQAAAVAERILALDLSHSHPGDATGRLIALGYLGDAGAVLAGLDGAESRLHTAAGHTVLTWAAEGPRASTTWRDAEQAREAIAALLRSRDHDARTRSRLLTLLRTLCTRTGRLARMGDQGPM